ncbi:MAG: c-type cytochrome [Elusimicrobiota bacterium]
MNTLKAAAVAATIFAAACREQKPTTDVQKGQAYFNALGCKSCHAIGDQGGGYGPNLTYIGFRKSPQWIALWLKDPHAWRAQTVMPNFHLSDEMRGALTAYLSTQKGQAWAASDSKPWDSPELMKDSVKRGKLIFNEVGCVGCHGMGGVGGYPNNNVVGGLIPSLTRVAEGYSKRELINKIHDGVIPTPQDPSAPAPMIHMPPWGQVLSRDEISAVADYLMSLDKTGAGKSSNGASNGF